MGTATMNGKEYRGLASVGEPTPEEAKEIEARKLAIRQEQVDRLMELRGTGGQHKKYMDEHPGRKPPDPIRAATEVKRSADDPASREQLRRTEQAAAPAAKPQSKPGYAWRPPMVAATEQASTAEPPAPAPKPAPVAKGDVPKSKYYGVQWHPVAKKWKAVICIGGSVKYLGVFGGEVDAARAYDAAAAPLGTNRTGRPRVLNFPDEHPGFGSRPAARPAEARPSVFAPRPEAEALPIDEEELGTPDEPGPPAEAEPDHFREAPEMVRDPGPTTCADLLRPLNEQIHAMIRIIEAIEGLAPAAVRKALSMILEAMGHEDDQEIR